MCVSSKLFYGGEGCARCALVANEVSGEGGVRTHDDHESHNGFRDRPDQPLRHLSSG